MSVPHSASDGWIPGSVSGVKPALFGWAAEGLHTTVSGSVWGWTRGVSGHSVSCFPRWAQVAHDPCQLTGLLILASPSLSAELVYSTFFQEAQCIQANKCQSLALLTVSFEHREMFTTEYWADQQERGLNSQITEWDLGVGLNPGGHSTITEPLPISTYTSEYIDLKTVFMIPGGTLTFCSVPTVHSSVNQSYGALSSQLTCSLLAIFGGGEIQIGLLA